MVRSIALTPGVTTKPMELVQDKWSQICHIYGAKINGATLLLSSLQFFALKI